MVRKEWGLEPICPADQIFALVSDEEIPQEFLRPKGEVPVFSFNSLEALVSKIIQTYLTPTTPPEAHFTHLDASGNASMVDVSEKPSTLREATARGRITLAPSTLRLLLEGGIPKGDVLSVARIAAIQGVKETSRLIPLCHPLPISHIEVSFQPVEPDSLDVTVRVKTQAPTGVEMEALTGVQIALLTIYDMCKAVDRSMVMANIRLLEKRGGRSGHYRREEE